MRTQWASLKSFLKTNNSDLTAGNIAGDTVANLITNKYYGAGDVNLTALKVKAEDFTDNDKLYKYGYTSRKGGNYELAATLKEGDIEKAYVVGNYQARVAADTATTGTGEALTSSSTRLKFAINAEDANKLLPGDIISGNGTNGKIISISDSLTSVIIEAANQTDRDSLVSASSIELANDEVGGLIGSANSLATPVVSDTENVPYNLQ
jgi:hypothetical protein